MGKAFLASEISEHEVLKTRAKELAKKISVAEDDSSEDSLVTFIMRGEKYAIDVSLVKEVVESEQLSIVPCTPDYVAGVISVRGHILAVMDLCSYAGEGALKNHNNKSNVLVLSSDLAENSFGILIDEVLDVAPVDPQKNNNVVGNSRITEFVSYVTDDLLMVLDGNKILNFPDFVVDESVGAVFND